MRHDISSRRFGTRVAAPLAAAALLLIAAPLSLRAQDAAKVYAPHELQARPKLAAPASAARTIQSSYPAKLRNAGISGEVEIEFVVGADGKVEDGTIEVLAATVPALADAAKAVAPKLSFVPGKVQGAPVRAKVTLPIIYRAQ